MIMKVLKEKLHEFPDSYTVEKVYIKARNIKHGESIEIEFEQLTDNKDGKLQSNEGVDNKG